MKQKIQPLGSLLSKSLPQINEQFSLLAEANTIYADLLPPRLQATYKVALIRLGEIVITTTNPELRYALNQFSHDFIRKLQKIQKFAHIKKVSLKVDVQLSKLQPNFHNTIGSHLDNAKRPSANAAKMIARISESIEDKELARALNNLAKLGLKP